MSDLPNLQDIKARYEAATEGPWVFNDNHDVESAKHLVVCNEGMGFVNEADGDFIAHARSDVPALVAALEAVIEDCQGIISDWDAEPVPDEFENGKALHAGDLLDLINQHLTIGDKQ